MKSNFRTAITGVFFKFLNWMNKSSSKNVVVSPWGRPPSEKGFWIKLPPEYTIATGAVIFDCPDEMKRWTNKEKDRLYISYNYEMFIQIIILSGYHVVYR